MKRIIHICSTTAAFSALLFCISNCPVQAQRFNLTTDFSTNQNPNGVWSYNLGGGPIVTRSTYVGSGFILAGWIPHPSLDGCIVKVLSRPSGLWHDCEIGDITIHVYSFGANDSITWTSPRTGKVDISGLAWDEAFDADRDASWAVLINGTIIAQRSTIYGTYRTNTLASFANNLVPSQRLDGIHVAAGDVIEFVTQKNTYAGHFMGVDITINYSDSLEITSQPQSQVGYWGKAVSFSVGVTNGTAPYAYRWQKDGVALPDATNATLVLTNLQMTNAGAYSVVVSDAVTNLTSTLANLTMNPSGVAIALYAGVTIDGVVGQTYGIQSTLDLSNTNSWVGRTNLTLTVPTYLWYDSQPATQPQTYYRVLPGPISIP
jgi:hypothetical protein